MTTVADQIAPSESLYRRVQDPNYSDWRTLRVEEVGPCTNLGKVYLSQPTTSTTTEIVRCGAATYGTWRDHEGRLFVLDSVSPRAVAAAVQAIETGAVVKFGSDHTVEVVS